MYDGITIGLPDILKRDEGPPMSEVEWRRSVRDSTTKNV